MSACEQMEHPPGVIRATAIEWDVTVDAYLMNAARVGNRYAAVVYRDLSGVILDGMTVFTPQVRPVEVRQGYLLVRSLDGGDHYVIVSEHSGDEGDTVAPSLISQAD